MRAYPAAKHDLQPHPISATAKRLMWTFVIEQLVVRGAVDGTLTMPPSFPPEPGALDDVHHRGQLSVYLRMAGGKVPSIYGPSHDEPWM